jgi:tRNA pseudouridine38/39 synthase
MDPSKYSTRFIALKFAYLGQQYNGFEHSANNKTPLPTIEEVVWRALMKAHLIFPRNATSETDEVDWEDCDYGKCGRTDRGVSAFGQVISIRVRSNRPLYRVTHKADDSPSTSGTSDSQEGGNNWSNSWEDVPFQGLSEDEGTDAGREFHHINDEIQYPQILNRLLPPDIRVLAWCPKPPPDFHARFSCRERQYRYFFTQPAFSPTPGMLGIRKGNPHGSSVQRREGWLDIDAMQDAASRFVGLHDFRNLCKVDASKQISDFTRRIYHSEIRQVDVDAEPAAYVSMAGFSQTSNNEDASVTTTTATPQIYMFVLHGSAFLWHQVRHMIAILFLIGQGLESPSLVDKLMDINAAPRKPLYEMADDAPLVLWDCIFPRKEKNGRADALDWIYVGNQNSDTVEVPGSPITRPSGKFGIGGTVDTVWKLWRQTKIDEILAGSLLNLLVRAGGDSASTSLERHQADASQKVFQGGDTVRTAGKYTQVMNRRRMDTVEEINRRYAVKKGLPSLEVGTKTTSRSHLEQRRDHFQDEQT